MAKRTDVKTRELGIRSAKVTFSVGLTQIVSMGVSVVMLVVLARLLQPTQYGIFTLASSVGAFFSTFSLYSIGHYLNKYIPVWVSRKKKDELSADIGASFIGLAATNLGAIAIGIALSSFISVYVFHNAGYTSLVDIALVSVITVQLMYLAYNALIGFKDGIGSAVTFSAGNLAIAVASITLVLLGHGAYGAMEGLVIGSAFGLAVGVFFITRHSSISLFAVGLVRRLRRILTFSLPLAIALLILGSVSYFAILYLGSFSSAAIVGSFGVSWDIGNIATTVTGFIGSVLVQMFASALESKRSKEMIKKLYNYSIYFGAVSGVPIAVYLIILAPSVVNSLFPGYRSSLLYTPAVTISLLIGVVGVYASSLLIGMGKVKKVLKYSVTIGVVQLGLLLFLVPLFNAYGVILAVYLAGSLISNYLYTNYMRKEMGIGTELRGIYRVIVSGVLLAVVLAPITIAPVSDTLRLLIGIAAVAVAYPVLLALTGAISRNETRLLGEIGRSMPPLTGIFDAIVSYISFFSR